MPINDYEKNIEKPDVERNLHREFVGGLWEEVGKWQFDLMTGIGGLLPHMKLLDLGCGCFRGGVYFIPYLRQGNYYGVDVNASLVDAGIEKELATAGVAHLFNRNQVAINDKFDASGFGVYFDRVVSVSLWTHLPLNHIAYSLSQLSKVTLPSAKCIITYFDAERNAMFGSKEQKMGIVTYPNQDPYHYPFDLIVSVVEYFQIPFKVRQLGSLGHPRGQMVLELTRY